MNSLLLAAAAANPTGGSFSFLIIIAIMFAIMYFTMIRPGKKQQTQRQTMLDGMKNGDAVVTIGGLHGVIDTINAADGTVVIDADGILLTFNRTAIRDVKPGVGATAAPAAPVAKEETTVTEEPTVDTHEENSDDSETK